MEGREASFHFLTANAAPYSTQTLGALLGLLLPAPLYPVVLELLPQRRWTSFAAVETSSFCLPKAATKLSRLRPLFKNSC